MAARFLGYLNMHTELTVKQWVTVVFPLLVTAVVAMILTTSAGHVIVAVALTEVVILVVFILELLKDYLMMRNIQGLRRR